MVWVGRKTEARDCRFFVFVFFCRPADALFSSDPGGGQGNLATHAVAQDCMFLSYFLCDARCFVFSFDMRFRLGTSPPRGTVGCAIFPFRVGFCLCLAPPATMVVCGRILPLVSLVFAPVFYFNSPFFVSPPPATPTIRGRVLMVVGLPIAPLSSCPPTTLAVRGRF